MGSSWSATDVPDLTGRRILVTGSNRGLGFATAAELAKNGCEVVMTARTMAKGNAAADQIRAQTPGAQLHVMELDLSRLASVREFADQFTKQFKVVHAVINNAGIASTDKMAFIETEDGLELVWQTNFYAPFLLTNLLMPALAKGATPACPSRVVMISSVTHAHARNNIDPSVGLERIGRKNKGHKKCYEYPATKLADLMFSATLHRKLEASDMKGQVLSVCAHPGFSITDMTGALGAVANAMFGMEASQGCLSQLRAAVDPEVESGEYIGPNTNHYGLQHVLGPMMLSHMSPYPEMYGYPTRTATRTAYSQDATVGDALWAQAEDATGEKFEL